MKYNSKRLPSLQKGFTLIEVLVVVAIIVVLAALTMSGIKSANQRAHAQETQVRIKAIEDWLSRYHNDNGEYPKPANKDLSGSFFGVTWPMGGAACLYQAVTGDGNDQIAGYRVRGDESAGASDGSLGSTKGQIYVKEMASSTKSWFKSTDGGPYAILDGFGLPFQYIPVDPNDASQELHNTTFDLWSYGNLKSPDDSTDAQGQWIKNW
jgi:prepilin-type N-terminal cleavage/methylation domain-containing protein